MIPAAFSLQTLQQLSSDAPAYQQTTMKINIRLQAVKQAAEQMGMQAGLAAESQVIDQQLESHGEQLDSIFNFNLVMYHNNVLPPVIVKSDNNLQIGNNDHTIRVAGQTYRIIQDAQFVTAPPTWRQYLWMSYPEPQYPNEVLLPQNDAEQQAWVTSVTQGWNEGVQQAIAIYHINLHKMVRDFDGMLQYKTMLLTHMVSPLYVTTYNNGITGNANDMSVDDRTLTITSQPQLQLQSKLWKPVVVGPQTQGDAQ